MIQVGDEVQDFDGDICTVLAVAGEEAAILHRDRGICARYLRDLTPHTPPAPEPPLTGEQMAYVLETLARIWTDQKSVAANVAAMAYGNAAKEFRK